MYQQGNTISESLLTQPFHPPSAEDPYASQDFLQEPQLQESELQQQQQYQQQIEDQLNSAQMFGVGALDLQPSLGADWQQQIYGDNIGLSLSNGLFGDVTTINDCLQLQMQAQQQQQQQLPGQAHTELSDAEQAPIRSLTPGPLQKTSIPPYLTMRRRSLSADNIHQLAKQHSRKTPLTAQPQQVEQNPFDRMPFPRTPLVDQTTATHETNQDSSGNMAIDHNASGHGNENNEANLNQGNPTPPSSLPSSGHQTPIVTGDPQSDVVNHTQRFNDLQARFKVKLDKRPNRNAPNIQVSTTVNPATMIPSKVMMPTGSGVGVVPGMDLTSISTPSTPTYHPDGPPPTKSTPPRRGHMRKRSLSAPQPFQNPAQAIPGAVALQPAQPFPPYLSNYNRRPGALPIQIQRNPKHNYNNPPMTSEEYQRKLDEELEKVDFEDITVSELKEMLRQRGKPATGKKAVLMQRLQEEVAQVKAKQNQGQQQNPQQNQPGTDNGDSPGSTQNNAQFTPGVSSPTSPSGLTLQRSLTNLHISSPSNHSRRFSPYGSVSIPSSPRILPNGTTGGNRPAGFNNGFSFGPSGDEWLQNNGIGQCTPTPTMEEAMGQARSVMLMMGNQQDYFGPQEPSSAPATTTEFGYQQPSSAPATTTEFGFEQQSQSTSAVGGEFDAMEYMPMIDVGINNGMVNVDFGDSEGLLMKQEQGLVEGQDGASSTGSPSSLQHAAQAGWSWA